MDYLFETITLVKGTSQQNLETSISLFLNQFKNICTEKPEFSKKKLNLCQ